MTLDHSVEIIEVFEGDLYLGAPSDAEGKCLTMDPVPFGFGSCYWQIYSPSDIAHCD